MAASPEVLPPPAFKPIHSRSESLSSQTSSLSSDSSYQNSKPFARREVPRQVSRITSNSTTSNISTESKRSVALKGSSIGKRVKFGFQLALGGYDPDNVRRAHDQAPHIRPKKPVPSINGEATATTWGQPKSSQFLTPAHTSPDLSRARTPDQSKSPPPEPVSTQREITSQPIQKDGGDKCDDKPFSRHPTMEIPEPYDVPTLDISVLDETSSTRFSKYSIPPPPPRQKASARLSNLNKRLEQQIELPPVVEVDEENMDEMELLQNLLGRMDRMSNQDAVAKPIPVRAYDIVYEEEVTPIQPPPRSKFRDLTFKSQKPSLFRSQDYSEKNRLEISNPLNLVSASNKIAFEAPDINEAQAQLAHKRNASSSSHNSSNDEVLSDPGMTDASSVSSVSTPAEADEHKELFDVSPAVTNIGTNNYFGVRS